MDPLLENAYMQYGMAMPSAAAFAGLPATQTYSSSNHSDHSVDPSSSNSPGGTPSMNMILTIRLLMQGKEVGSIIGKRGDQVKKIREESGAKINISDGSCPERIVTITGSLPTINKAFDMISTKFEEDMKALPNSVPKPPITMRLIVPATQCGSLIGKGGSKIKDIREATGASIQVASEMLPGSTERAVTISGTADSIVLCMAQVAQILLEAPPKGATLPYRPKPSFNPYLIASSAAAAAAAQQQQLAALLQPNLLQQQLLAAELARGVQPAAHQLGTASAYLSAPTLNHPQVADLSMFAGGGLIYGQLQDAAKLQQAAHMWQQQDDKQLELLNHVGQLHALNSSVLMGAPLLKQQAAPPTSSAAAAHKTASTRFTPY